MTKPQIKITRLLCTFLLAFLVLGCGKSTDGNPNDSGTPNPSPSDDPFAQIVTDTYRPYIAQPQSVGVSIGISVDGKEYFYNLGEIKKGTGIIPDENTVYEIGSISKTFAAILTVDFLNKNGIDLDESIASYLPPEVPTLERDGVEVTFKHVLNHTTGLPREPADLSGSNRATYTAERIFQALQHVTLNSTPGERYVYSNFAYGMLSALLERSWGERYGAHLNDLIVAPLQMTRTFTRLADYPDWNTPEMNIATGYSSAGNQVNYRDPNEQGGFKGSGAVNSTIKDMLNYGRHQIDTENSPIGDLMLKTQQQTMQSGSIRKGLAWTLRSVGGLECLHHSGATSGFNSSILVSKQNNIVIAVLANNAGTNIDSRMLDMAVKVFNAK